MCVWFVMQCDFIALYTMSVMKWATCQSRGVSRGWCSGADIISYFQMLHCCFLSVMTSWRTWKHHTERPWIGLSVKPGTFLSPSCRKMYKSWTTSCFLVVNPMQCVMLLVTNLPRLGYTHSIYPLIPILRSCHHRSYFTVQQAVIQLFVCLCINTSSPARSHF